MKKWCIQEESDDKDNKDKWKSFREDPKQVQYKESL